MLDKGLQVERTRLAWRRTMLATGVLVCAAVKMAVWFGSRWSLVSLCAVVLFSVECMTYGFRRRRYEEWFRSADRSETPHRQFGGGGLCAMAVCLTLIALCSLFAASVPIP